MSSSFPPPSPPLPTAETPPVSSSFMWKHLFADVSTPPSAPSASLPDGTPVILAPPDIILHASAAWSGYLLCQFFGDNPSPAKIFSVLNPIWARQGKITVKSFSEGTCLILVPSLSTRKWILESCLWSAGTVSFVVSEWSPTPTLISKSLSSAPIWLTIREIPPQLWSEAGAKLIASRLGTVVPTSRVILPPDSLGSAKVRVIIRLDAPRPSSAIVQDSSGHQVRVSLDYGRLPSLCSSCKSFGHLIHRCPSRRRSCSTTSSPSTDPILPPLMNSATFLPPSSTAIGVPTDDLEAPAASSFGEEPLI